MAFGSDEFPLGPAGGFPRQRIHSAGKMIFPPMSKEDVYMNTEEARLPVVEKDFHSSVSKAHNRMKFGMSHDMKRLGSPVHPRFTEGRLNRAFKAMKRGKY